VETVALPPPTERRPAPRKELEPVETPNVRTIDELCACLHVTPQQCLKTLLVQGAETPAVALLLRGDHELNSLKAESMDAVAKPIR